MKNLDPNNYPEEFKAKVRERFPHWKDMHQWLEWGELCVLTYLTTKAPDLYKAFYVEHRSDVSIFPCVYVREEAKKCDAQK